MKRLATILAFLFAVSAWGQGGYYGNMALVPSRSGSVGQSVPVMTVPFASVQVYAANGTPAALFSDATLAIHLQQPIIADASGHYGFFAAAGTYNALITSSSGASIGVFPFTIGGGSSSAPTSVVCVSGCTATVDSSGTVSLTITGGGATPTASTPTASPAAGTYSTTQSVALAATGASAIHFAQNTTATCSSTAYTSAVSVTATGYISAINCPAGYTASAVLTAAYTISGGASLYPQTAPLSGVGLGQNPLMNGFLPFCPSPSNCSVIYKDTTGDPVDTTADAAFHGYSNYATAHLGPNFDSTSASLPNYFVDTTPGQDSGITYVPVTSASIPTESDDMLVPLKSDMVQEGNGNPNVPWTGDGRDRHLGIYDRRTGKGSDTYQLQTKSDGTGDLYSNTAWDLNLPIEQQNTGGYTSADAAGMPQIAMGVTYEDLAAGEIKHMLRMTVPHTSCGGYASGDTYGLYSSPASHAACSGGGTYVAYMGEILRVKASTALPSGCGPQGTVIFNAMKKHGLMITDNGIFGLIQGTYDTRINQSDVACIAALAGSDLEVVKVNNAVLTAGELNPETLTAGATASYNQTGITSTTTGLGTAIVNSPVAPAVTSFTSSASTVAIGSCVTLTLAASNAVKTTVNNAYGIISGNSGTLSVCPTQSTSYTAKVRGLHGYAYSSAVPVTVTGPTVATPTSSPTPGTFTSPTAVTLADSTAGASLYYTLDGSSPSSGSTLYSSPFTLSSPQTVRAIGIKSGMINSAVLSAYYNIAIPGATPNMFGTSTSPQSDGVSNSVTRTFTAGNSALIYLSWVNTTSLPTSVTVGSTAATLITSKANTNSPIWSEGAYLVQTVSGGPQAVTATWPTSVYSTVGVSEVSGSSGVDAYASSNLDSYPLQNCGSLTTTGTNRLGFVASTVTNGSYTAASSGYTQLFAYGGTGAATLPIASASTTAMTMNEHDSGISACISLALKP